jgi:hypothetical protein
MGQGNWSRLSSAGEPGPALTALPEYLNDPKWSKQPSGQSKQLLHQSDGHDWAVRGVSGCYPQHARTRNPKP